jgi:hypothetical protein
MKADGKLIRTICEYKGNEQGHVRGIGHFKTYISDSNLGLWIGPVCVTSVCFADDNYVLSSTPSGLQGAPDIVSHYGKRYKLTINADKKVDMQCYRDTRPWKLNGERVSVVEKNENLGLIVSWLLFGLLGSAYSFRCMLTPVVQVLSFPVIVNCQ